MESPLNDPLAKKALGAFFTPDEMATELCAGASGRIQAGAPTIDPAIGDGQLLLAAAAHLPTRNTLDATMEAWGKVLYGGDIEASFVHAARKRLIAAAAKRVGEHAPKDVPLDWLPGIRLQDFAAREDLGEFDVFLLNPPFTHERAKALKWASGKVNTAAVFVHRIAEHATPGSAVSAILPDVLRSGSRYEAWRKSIDHLMPSSSISPWGAFDDDTGVDVFLGDFQVGHSGPSRAWTPPPGESHRLEQSFNLKVGPLVDYRAPKEGKVVRYLDRDWIRDGTIHKRKFRGPLIDGPFVTVHRTSAPRDTPRLRARTMAESGSYAVENHLITVKPRSGQLRDCERLVKWMQTKSIREWVNERAACRHLTIRLLRNLPLPVVGRAVDRGQAVA